MYDYHFAVPDPKKRPRHGSVEWLTSYDISDIPKPELCTYREL